MAQQDSHSAPVTSFVSHSGLAPPKSTYDDVTPNDPNTLLGMIDARVLALLNAKVKTWSFQTFSFVPYAGTAPEVTHTRKCVWHGVEHINIRTTRNLFSEGLSIHKDVWDRGQMTDDIEYIMAVTVDSLFLKAREAHKGTCDETKLLEVQVKPARLSPNMGTPSWPSLCAFHVIEQKKRSGVTQHLNLIAFIKKYAILAISPTKTTCIDLCEYLFCSRTT